MERTRKRPLPAGRIKVKNAAVFFLITLLTGLTVIYFAGNIKAALIGLATIIWYNGVYTYFKRITAFAVVPGAITGALPPLIGWVAAGGGLWDRPIIFIEFLFFMAQIPHFWLLLLKYGEEYKKAGFPTLFDFFSRMQVYRLTFIWIVTSVIAVLFLCFFGIIQNQLIIGILLVASIYIVIQFFDLIRTQLNTNYRRYSIFLDSYLLLVIILLISDRIVI
jgi:protoheme IX farnesyltransferase